MHEHQVNVQTVLGVNGNHIHLVVKELELHIIIPSKRDCKTNGTKYVLLLGGASLKA